MHQVKVVGKYGIFMALSSFLFLTFGSNQLLAQQSFTLSKNSDFSTDDRIFTHDDTLFMKVVAPNIDFTDIDKNEFKLKANHDGEDFEGAFTNLLNTMYTAKLPLKFLNSSEENWRWKARIRDDSGHEFSAEVELSILGGTKQEQVKIAGKIELLDLGNGFLVVKGTTIIFDDAIIIQDKDDVLLSFSDLRVGENVKVKAIRQENGELLALAIEVKDREKGEIEVKGRIVSLGPDSLVVLGKTFFVDDNTSIRGEGNKSISFSELKVGLIVKVKAKLNPDGRLLATRIKVEEEEGEIELTGFIDELSIEDDTLKVSGITFFVNESTKIFDENKNPITFDELSVGQLVEIHAVQQLDGTLLATKIELEDELPGENEIEITGAIKEIDKVNNRLVVSDFQFSVDENTVILDDHKRVISFDDLQVGIVVEVKAAVQPDGSFLATRIKIEDRLKNEIEITGVIQSMSIPDSVVVVNELEFVVDEHTVILDNKKNLIMFSDLQEGVTVEIHADILVDGTRLATKIAIKQRDENEIEVTGTIDILGANDLTVAGVKFLVDASTLILDNKKNPITFSQLMEGQIVEVKGERQPDGTFLATRIKIEDRFEDEVEVKGPVESLTDNTITVLGLTFSVIENTVVLDNNKHPILFSELMPDQFVEIRGELLPGGTLVALRIKVEDNQQNQLEVKGSIDSLRNNNIFVLGIKIQVGSNTEIFDKKKNPISFSDLKVGQFVEVRAQKQSDGSFLATRIKIEDVLVISGSVSAISMNTISIFNSELMVDENTLVLGTQNLPLSFNELTKGQTLAARAIRLDSGILLASKIKVLNVDTITGIGDFDAGVTEPKDFVLEQNYPNPFNPTTTITFKLPEAGNRQSVVSLVIYNVLGQSVRTLVDQEPRSGINKIQWDGRDDFGNTMPSGVYLYRLKVGQFSETRRLALIR